MFPFDSFNRMQSHMLRHLLHSDVNAVVAAPTGSGKTVLLELAILRLMQQRFVDCGVALACHLPSLLKCLFVPP